MTVGEPPRGSRFGEIRLVIVESPDLAAPLVGALDAAEIGAWVWVEAEHCLYWSPGIPEMLGLDHSDADPVAAFVSRIDPDDRLQVETLIQGDWREDVFSLRFRYRHPDQGSRWLFMSGRLERGVDGTLIRQGGTIRDVTADVQREEHRLEASARLEALVNAMPFSVWGRSGQNFILTHMNAASMDLWGDIRGTGLEAVPPEVSELWHRQLTDVMSGKEVRTYSRVTRRGRDMVLRDIIAPVTVQGEVTGVVGVALDVTDEHRRREFEALLTEMAADLVSRSWDTLDLALTSALERIGTFLHARLAGLCEIASDEQARLTHWWIDPKSGRDRPLMMEADGVPIAPLLARLRANQAQLVNSLSEIPEHEREWFAARRLQSFVIVPATREEGQLVVLGLVGGPDEIIEWPPDTIPLLRLAATLLAGVLARQRAEANRRVIEQRMQDTQKLESLGVLAGGIAHDFNNLLTAILGNASLLRAEMPRLDGVQGPLEQIEIASRRAADLCRQMLAYAGRGRFALQPVDLNDVVQHSESLLRVTVPKRGELDLQLTPTLPQVLADYAQIRQALINLLLNAAEAIGDREGRITIATAEISCTAEELAGTVFSPELAAGRYVSLSVTDNGGGMTPEVMARIFEPFFSTKFTGRGLGLSAVAGIVRAHRGALRVTSAEGTGARFELLLPVAPQAAGPPPAKPLSGVRQSAAKWRASGTVLVVDDEPGVRDLVRTVLERAGLRVVIAADGRAGVEAFGPIADEVRLVLLDLTMPGLNGMEALAAMRLIKPGVRAILMSGYSPSDVVNARSHGFLHKPFTPEKVRAAVRKALE